MIIFFFAKQPGKQPKVLPGSFQWSVHLCRADYIRPANRNIPDAPPCDGSTVTVLVYLCYLPISTRIWDFHENDTVIRNDMFETLHPPNPPLHLPSTLGQYIEYCNVVMWKSCWIIYCHCIRQSKTTGPKMKVAAITLLIRKA